jgi:hypothetical protein
MKTFKLDQAALNELEKFELSPEVLENLEFSVTKELGKVVPKKIINGFKGRKLFPTEIGLNGYFFHEKLKIVIHLHHTFNHGMVRMAHTICRKQYYIILDNGKYEKTCKTLVQTRSRYEV